MDETIVRALVLLLGHVSSESDDPDEVDAALQLQGRLMQRLRDQQSPAFDPSALIPQERVSIAAVPRR